MIKVLNMGRDTIITLKRKEIKNGKYKKNLTSTVKFLNFIFCIWKRIYIARKHSLGKCSSYNDISRKAFLVMQDIGNEVMKHQRPYKSSLVL